MITRKEIKSVLRTLNRTAIFKAAKQRGVNVNDKRNVLQFIQDYAPSQKVKRKAWDIINEMERELGFKVVHRRHGGREGGSTELTEAGHRFLHQYLELENDIKRYAYERFQDLFADYIENEG